MKTFTRRSLLGCKCAHIFSMFGNDGTNPVLFNLSRDAQSGNLSNAQL